MGHNELIASLRKETEEKISAIRVRTDEEIKDIRKDLSNKIARLRDEYREKQESVRLNQEESMRQDTLKTVRRIKLTAEKALSDRLLPLAFSCLPALRDKRYGTMFSLLVRELPPESWGEVWVNAEDSGRAGELFPDAKVFTKETVTGGLEVGRMDGKVRIANTFEKRLERAWEDVFPLIMKDCYMEVEGDDRPPE